MSDVEISFEYSESNFNAELEHMRFRQLFSTPKVNAVTLTEGILNDFGIAGFFVFELNFPPSFLCGVGTLPPAFLKGIKENGLLNSDQVLRHLTADLRKLPKPMFRSVVDNYIKDAPCSPKAFERHREFDDYLKTFCITEIYYYPFRKKDFKNSAVFCLYGTGDIDKFRRSVENFGPRIEPLARAFCDSVNLKEVSKRNSVILGIITPRPLSITKLIAEKDLSASEAARFLGLHEVTVNKHIAAAKKSVGASTLAGLVAQCLKLGYFTIDDIC